MEFDLIEEMMFTTGFCATEIRNLLGDYGIEELDVACEAEEGEKLSEEIATSIVKSHGYNNGLYSNVFEFSKVCEVLEEEGFEYMWGDNRREEHLFFNPTTGYNLSIFPKTYYEMQGEFKFRNFLLYKGECPSRNNI